MPPTHLERVFQNPWYALLAALLAVGMFALYVYTQVLSNLSNVDVWVKNIPLLNAGLLGAFVLLFGITFAYQISLWMGPRKCALRKQVKGTGASGAGTLAVFLIAQCPACASLGALFLPVSVLGFIAQYTIPLNILSIVLLVFTLHYLGAFQREK